MCGGAAHLLAPWLAASLSLMAEYHCSAVSCVTKQSDSEPCSADRCFSGQCRMTVHCQQIFVSVILCSTLAAMYVA